MDDVALGVRVLVAQVSPELDTADQVAGADRLGDLGLDGQDIFDLTHFLEAKFGVGLDDRFEASTTVDAVSGAVRRAQTVAI